MAEENVNARLETFCDGVFAIALTLLIIDIKLPSSDAITTGAEFGGALRHIAPSMFAFVLSFVVIFITWVNHHSLLKLVNRSSGAFMYSNGFLLLTVVFVPFPTSLMGEYILSDVAGPVVALYNAILAVQGIAWIFLGESALHGQLAKNEQSAVKMRGSRKNGYFAFIVYALFAIIAFWFPLTVAICTALTWIFWLVLGIRLRHE